MIAGREHGDGRRLVFPYLVKRRLGQDRGRREGNAAQCHGGKRAL